MENFFYNYTFYKCIEDLDYEFDSVPDDWQIKVELTDLEPIFSVDAEYLCYLLGDSNEERISEDFNERDKLIKALKESVDFEKLEKLMPTLYYGNGKYQILTKQDLI